MSKWTRIAEGLQQSSSKIGAAVDMCCGHREYAPHRKQDPLFDMDQFRSDVQAIMHGSGTTRPLIPAVAPDGKPTLRRGSRGDFVKTAQGKVEVPVDGVFGPRTEAAVRDFQRQHNLNPDGIVGPKTWASFSAN
jgi:peptidoglycan hydrolase-like protein with peptidoglycan-binding domain